MKLERAIEVIGSNGLCDAEVTWGDYLKAVQLGREALKATIRARQGDPPLDGELLPGETEE